MTGLLLGVALAGPTVELGLDAGLDIDANDQPGACTQDPCLRTLSPLGSFTLALRPAPSWSVGLRVASTPKLSDLYLQERELRQLVYLPSATLLQPRLSALAELDFVALSYGAEQRIGLVGGLGLGVASYGVYYLDLTGLLEAPSELRPVGRLSAALELVPEPWGARLELSSLVVYRDDPSDHWTARTALTLGLTRSFGA